MERVCRHFGLCGGCSLQHVGYEAQVEQRRSFAASLLERELGVGRVPPVSAVPMREPWNHRSKMEFTFGRENDRVLLGLHQKGNFRRIVDIEQCEIAHPEVSKLLRAVKEAAGSSGLPAYDTRWHEGFWRFAVIRVSRSTGRLMLLVITNEGSREPLEAMAQQLQREVPALASFYWGVTANISDVARPERLELLCGEEVVEDSVGPIRFAFGPTTFMQPNHSLVESAYGAIRENARLDGSQTLYDLYCGIGLISLFVAGAAKTVYGVESEQQNIDFAERNAGMNGISNATFFCAKVEDVLKGGALFRSAPPPDVVVVDPPRAGLHKEVVGPLLAARPPRLLYLSCNPASLSRDLKVILDRDPSYHIESLTMFDFFPHTEHLELLATISRGVI